MTCAPLADATDARTFGGKAAGLAAALRAGLPVPAAVALAVPFTEEVVRGSPRAIAELEGAWRTLEGPVAVRSSAVGEDSITASFAGQHHTRLNVCSLGGLRSAIEGIWLSARSEAALGYRERLGITAAPEVGVVLQTLLDPDSAGVMFTRHPTGDGQERLIEASWGLGGTVAAGRVIPDRYRLGAFGEVLEMTPGRKWVELRSLPNGGTAEQALAHDLVGRLCLGERELGELDDLARRCEDLFGGPQDIEWAFARPRLHLLQVRPVTAG